MSGVVATALLQAAVWWGSVQGWLTVDQTLSLLVLTTWTAVLVIGVFATRIIGRLRDELKIRSDHHAATLSEVEQLDIRNEMLTTAGRSNDGGLVFQALARRVGKLIACDRIGLALVKDGGEDVQIYSSRVSEPERRRRPRPELQFGLERSIFGRVIRTCEPMLVDDTATFASEFQDAGVLASQGFRSLLIVPLVSRNRAIGALTVIARKKEAFAPEHRAVLQPLAEILAFAHVAQRQHLALDRYKAMEATAEMTLMLASDINGCLQVIIGRCAVLQSEKPTMADELEVIAKQAERIATLLERERTLAEDRLHVASTTAESFRSSPEEYADEEDSR